MHLGPWFVAPAGPQWAFEIQKQQAEDLALARVRKVPRERDLQQSAVPGELKKGASQVERRLEEVV